jgi:hypothetical protein
VTREDAERERARQAEQQPDATWLIAENKPGDWSIIKVGSQNFSNWGVG